MERLPRQQSAENHAPHGGRVHPAIFAPRSTEWVPPHSLLRVPRQSTPQGEVGALPPTSRHGSSKGRLCRARDTRGLSGSIREAHGPLSAGMSRLSSRSHDRGQGAASSSLCTDHPRHFMSDRKRIQIAFATSSTLSSQRSAVASCCSDHPADRKDPAFCPASSRRRHPTATQHARIRTYLPACAHYVASHLSSKTHSAHTLQRFSAKHF